MRDNNFEKISNVEKPIRNSFTNKGAYALIEIIGKEFFPDAKIRDRQMLYANIVRISEKMKNWSSLLKSQTESSKSSAHNVWNQ